MYLRIVSEKNSTLCWKNEWENTKNLQWNYERMKKKAKDTKFFFNKF